MKTKQSVTFLLLIFLHQFLVAQSLRINEVSQGGTGTQREWVELVVTPGTPGPAPGSCSNFTFNASGWILDDNDGTFSPTNHYSGSGIAGGHLRFKNQAPWNNLPVGALIVIYNASDKDPLIPADDPFDLANTDCVYIMPSNHASIEMNNNAPLTLPNVATGAAPAPCNNYLGYTGSTYTNATLTSWGQVSLANGGDAMQIRDASYNLIHAVSFGVASSGCTGALPLTGNASGPYINPTTSANDSYYFDGSAVSDYFTAASWVYRVQSSATPGTGNNAANTTFISNVLRGGCTCSQILPENKFQLRLLKKENNRVELQWNNLLAGDGNYTVERSFDGLSFASVVSLQVAGNNQVSKWNGMQAAAPQTFYRIKASSSNGKIVYSNIVKSGPSKEPAVISFYPNPFTDHIVLQRNYLLP